MESKQQTALEWFAQRIQSDKIFSFDVVLKQAIQMEREQIIEAFDEGQEYEYQYHVNSTPKFDSETYFNETYGK